MMNSKRTAKARKRVSAPLRHILPLKGTTLQIGAGRPDNPDREYMDWNYDPNWPSDGVPEGQYSQVFCAYVLNVLVPEDRRTVVQLLRKHSTVAYVAVRCDEIKGAPFSDGVLTTIGTFQKSYTLEELYKDLLPCFNTFTLLKKTRGFILIKAEALS